MSEVDKGIDIKNFEDIKVDININAHMYKSELYRMAGYSPLLDFDQGEAEILAMQHGYNSCIYIRSEPTYLTTYPSLRKKWLEGWQLAQHSEEIDACDECQDPDVVLWGVHQVSYNTSVTNSGHTIKSPKRF